MVHPLLGGLSSFGVSFIGGFTVEAEQTCTLTIMVWADILSAMG